MRGVLNAAADPIAGGRMRNLESRPFFWKGHRMPALMTTPIAFLGLSLPWRRETPAPRPSGGPGLQGHAPHTGTPWRVHDGDRPQPRVVTPGATFSLLAPPPSDAVVLFDGKDLSKWESVKGGEPKWTLAAGYVEVVPFSGDIRTKQRFADFQLHLEYAEPAVVKGKGQARATAASSSTGCMRCRSSTRTTARPIRTGRRGALRADAAPRERLQAAGRWQTYDIIFESPRWDGCRGPR